MATRYIGYAAVHTRVRLARGSASKYPCWACGKPAKDWAYDHSDQDELHESAFGAFSRDVNRYRPMCRSCHRLMDSAVAKSSGAAR